MKAVFIAFNQANTERVEFIFDQMGIKGYTFWNDVMGHGTNTGEPRMGTHTWPEMNSAILTIISDELVELLLTNIKKLDELNKEVGVRAFVWEVTKTV
ncbi:MAG: PG0541 family transporter-associated protein [Lentimicrobiaceae bacterium]